MKLSSVPNPQRQASTSTWRFHWSVFLSSLKTCAWIQTQKSVAPLIRSTTFPTCFGAAPPSTHLRPSLHHLLTLSLPLHSYNASQADVAVFKALSSAPDAAKYPHAARWYKHIASFEPEFATLTGDASKPYTVYGPDASEVTLNPAKAPAAADDDDDVDLFGSDDEEEDAEAARIREERLAEYRKKKEGKTKPAAKSVVTLDVKPWGMFFVPIFRWIDSGPMALGTPSDQVLTTVTQQMTRPT